MGFEYSSFLLLIKNNEFLFAAGVAFCIIMISIVMKSPSILSNYNDQSILTKIKNDFRIKTKAVQDISEVKHLTEHVREQTEIIKSSIKSAGAFTDDVSKFIKFVENCFLINYYQRSRKKIE